MWGSHVFIKKFISHPLSRGGGGGGYSPLIIHTVFKKKTTSDKIPPSPTFGGGGLVFKTSVESVKKCKYLTTEQNGQ